MVRFALIGPLTVGDGEAEPVALRAGMPRTILAALLLNANQVVPTELLTDAVWEQHPPAAAAQSLRNHVLRLRRQLGSGPGARGCGRSPRAI
ncbi:AfsR/SARP family transcriptional regulator [Streptacidiphilus sp. PAMC 29251]